MDAGLTRVGAPEPKWLCLRLPRASSFMFLTSEMAQYYSLLMQLSHWGYIILSHDLSFLVCFYHLFTV
ncbi:hypothetical protein RSAG8_13238, partial [Rhizoctonia solani AG-8 WAC10335]